MNLLEFLEYSKVGFITTGSIALDEVIGGGIPTGSITEIYGPYGSGKTQLCHQLSVNVQLPEELGGLSARAVYIDTEGTFRPERIVQMAQAKGLKPEETLKNIIYAKALSLDDQRKTISDIPIIMEYANVKLVIIDTFIAHIRSVEDPMTRAKILAEQLKVLRNIAYQYNVAVILTNHAPLKGNELWLPGGYLLENYVDLKILTRKINENIKVELIRSPHRVPGNVMLIITNEGLKDVKGY